MKKLVFLLLLVFCLTASVPAIAADAEYALLPDSGGKTVFAPDGSDSALDNAEAADRSGLSDVLSDWEANGYPDDIGGVFYDQETGKMTILLVNLNAERENELKALVPGAAVLPCVYSYNDLITAHGAITKEMASQQDGEAVIYSAGIGYTMIDGKVTGFGESGKEFRVVVTVDESVYAQTSDRLHQLYGDKVYVESGTAPVLTANDSLLVAPTPAGAARYWQFGLIAAALLAALATAFMLNRRRHGYAVQTANGDTVTLSGRMTRKQVVEAICDATVSPDDAVYERILKDL